MTATGVGSASERARKWSESFRTGVGAGGYPCVSPSPIGSTRPFFGCCARGDDRFGDWSDTRHSHFRPQRLATIRQKLPLIGQDISLTYQPIICYTQKLT